MSDKTDPMADIKASFFIECEELLEALQDGLQAIDDGSSDDETINVVFRAAHSIKGGGGALLQEKIVATASDRMIVITDPSKDVGTLGAFPLPVEVIEFGWQTTRTLIVELLASLDVGGREISLRDDGGAPYRTDEGNLILDLHLKRIGNARQLGLVLNQIPGVVENGLFTDICNEVIIGHEDGTAELRTFDGPRSPGMPSLSENLFASLGE